MILNHSRLKIRIDTEAFLGREALKAQTVACLWDLRRVPISREFDTIPGLYRFHRR